MSHPLDKEFGMSDFDDEILEFDIPDEKEQRDLDLIIDFALRAYKQQMDDLTLIEPKSRIKYLEIAERFLGQAKDARYKRDYLILKRDEMNKKKQLDASKKGAGAAESEGGTGASIGRDELLERREARRKAK